MFIYVYVLGNPKSRVFLSGLSSQHIVVELKGKTNEYFSLYYKTNLCGYVSFVIRSSSSSYSSSTSVTSNIHS